MELGKFEDFTYRYYDKIDKRLIDFYHYAHEKVKEDGNAMINTADEIETAIVLEKDNKIAAVTFLNVTKRSGAILIHLIWVEAEFRNKHIHRTMHQYIDRIGKMLNKKMVISSVHANNKHMLENIVDKIKYEPIFIMYKRDLE